MMKINGLEMIAPLNSHISFNSGSALTLSGRRKYRH